MSSSPTILRPEISVPLSCGHVLIREMPGLDALEFFVLLAKHAKGVFAGLLTVSKNAAGENKLGLDPANIPLLLEKLEDVVRGSRELVTHLVTKSLGNGASLGDYGTLHLMALLDAAIEVNLTADHIAMAKKVGGRVAAFLVAPKSATPPAAIS